ncbi:zinc-dependent alcohol dehydrogenase family protein [Niallia sp. FSL W8-0635]|uniref:zinc-dependent alcohol dehydrogenase family protein n=1 Tax=Niallia sp. FSL W8-0635 TaxID=2975337 RepID=UPI0009D62B77|nr:alcohol dehydrogenase [Mycobacteroides abscessus subsp. abscessus]HEO8422454.1 zinc-dependent alcohol dehydrogenase family protein [Yersinia enterocolitica]
MKAMIIDTFGKSSVFKLKEIEVAALLPGQVRIRVKATSVNPIDIKVRAGAVPAVSPSFPAVLHGDVAGIIEEVGEGVKSFRVGDEVYGCGGGFKGLEGALAEYMNVDARVLAHKPLNISMEEAAAVPLVGITAWESLFTKGALKKGDDILIHGGAGGVGHIAIRLAKWAGATVYTTISSSEKETIVRELGADHVIPYRESSVKDYVEKYTEGKGFPFVFDTVGGSNLDRSFEAASVNGTVLSIAARSTHDLTPVHSKGLSLHVTFMLLKLLDEAKRFEHGEILEKISGIIEGNGLSPLLDQKTFTFEEVGKAHDYLESGKAVGKVILVNKW